MTASPETPVGAASAAHAAPLKAPFPWFGGKSRVAPLIWQAFGEVRNYVEPFFGSGAVLLGRPLPFSGPETINDLDGFVVNAWRAIRADPAETARWADWPVTEADLHARHLWLIERRDDLSARLMADPEWYDAQIAGWWLWGLCIWIGSGWCSGKGPWQAAEGRLTDTRQRPHLGNAGRGVHRKLPHLGNAGRGVHRKLPHLGDAGRGLADWFGVLAARLRRVRVCCGDWSRVTGPSVTEKLGLTGVFLDPPYLVKAGRTTDIYRTDHPAVAARVREWALANGHNPKLRIALCGYDGEHAMPDSWACVAWKTPGGYGNQGAGMGRANAARERLWLSPACLPVEPTP